MRRVEKEEGQRRVYTELGAWKPEEPYQSLHQGEEDRLVKPGDRKGKERGRSSHGEIKSLEIRREFETRTAK